MIWVYLLVLQITLLPWEVLLSVHTLPFVLAGSQGQAPGVMGIVAAKGCACNPTTQRGLAGDLDYLHQ